MALAPPRYYVSETERPILSVAAAMLGLLPLSKRRQEGFELLDPLGPIPAQLLSEQVRFAREPGPSV
jgi:hypothetical protein